MNGERKMATFLSLRPTGDGRPRRWTHLAAGKGFGGGFGSASTAKASSQAGAKSLAPMAKKKITFSLDEEEVDPGVVDGLEIVKYPHPALRAKNEEIREFSTEGVKRLVTRMFKLMYAAGGVGLAAPQVGINKRLMVFNPSGRMRRKDSEMILLNPQIVDQSLQKDVMDEGCLSFPDMNGPVTRSMEITVQYNTLDGKSTKRTLSGWEARIFQHEYDHIDGVVYIDRLPPEARERVQPQLDRLVKDYEERTGKPGAL
ncbi:unnamed protein product [Vitrella brassicaformis CCMP3155]|uniref:Peptide deformylase n=1 Tax=Vitrella brassicaformis (strain CCMP3155) TaxID=1169540 RepID=A0A0G4FVR9_VITBC|nr:unnamed protein product [Vitrella brassicaformis CCMP3155]|eukprot:CEM18852.1 unnamed protein product [Vitrella brassicaformis CCMP3155]